jgi:inorganic pyrophosphatase/exopolyphosphatase
MKALKDYIVSAKQFNTPKIRALVLGNSSADMDSVVGAMTLSWYFGSLKNDNNLQYVPMINCTREELKMRIDIINHLNTFGMNDEFLKNVIFNDDISESNDSLNDVESVALVDFNQLTKDLEPKLCDKIHYIIDHHVDSNMYLETIKHKEIKLIGSACTLVAQMIMNEQNAMDSDLAMFLSAPISLDSYNFADFFHGSKWVDQDKEVFQMLQKQNEALMSDPAAYWKILHESKQDIQANLDLGCYAILVKDLKIYDLLGNKSIGVASAVVPL